MLYFCTPQLNTNVHDDNVREHEMCGDHFDGSFNGAFLIQNAHRQYFLPPLHMSLADTGLFVTQQVCFYVPSLINWINCSTSIYLNGCAHDIRRPAGLLEKDIRVLRK